MRRLGWTKEEARRFLAAHHFGPGSEAVFERLGSVQYDPLCPQGRNHDLVLQARMPGYRVDDWQVEAYERRRVYDAWDKQACLVPVSDWPQRRIYHRWREEQWRQRVFEPHGAAVEATLEELRRRGPLSSLEFEDDRRVEAWADSWYGPKLVKQVLRALWDSGRVATHHRDKGRHAYHLAERVIPEEHFNRAGPADPEENLRWLLLRRHQNVGLLSPGADASLWGMPLLARRRAELLEALVADGELVEVDVEGRRFHARPVDLESAPAAADERMRFLAPLDNLLWDRRAVRWIFDFDYVWEVYKPESQRRWGYYVLPVYWRGSLVGRFDARQQGETWRVSRWWWEPSFTPGAAALQALEEAAAAFMRYLGAARLTVARGVDRATAQALRAGGAGAG